MKITAAEIRELAELDRLCFEPPVSYTVRDVREYVSSPGTILLREYDGGRLAAFCLGDAMDGCVITLDVHPEYRRRGLARKLLAQLLDEFSRAGVRKAVAQIAVDNLPSIALHKSFGFEIRYILYDYYPDGSAAWELELFMKQYRKSRQSPDN
ncbi:MAG TPA: GNAT family N-acetyltransferase [Candidatus Sumerlaeota bacterium]|nr:GNAT family N-acetyltransferase [Candidatus Sumerlaeota bacterium]